jgi:hypothetical protein
MRIEQYTEKTTKLVSSDWAIVADSEDTDADGDPKTKKFRGSGLDKPDAIYDFPAGSFNYNTTPAPFDWDTGANGRIGRQRFDDTTEEFVLGLLEVPSDLYTTGNVTFEYWGYAQACTPTTTGKIEMTVRVSPKTGDESWDGAYTTTTTGDMTLATTQDLLDHFTKTVSVSTLGLAANDHTRLKLSRTAPTTQNQSGDYGLTKWRVRIPRI